MIDHLSVQRFFLIALVSICRLTAGGTPIHESLALDIGGIKQWVTIQAEDDRLPVLLFLHGGPGNSVMGYAEKFTDKLQKHFVVAQWDQRESGKTASLNSSDKSLTVTLMEDDALEVIRYLRTRFDKETIYLTGHSWGGFLGLKIASDHPELLAAYIAVSPMVNQLESERLSLKWMISKATEENNKQALSDLAKVHVPFQNGEELYYHRAWIAHYMGNKFPAKDFVTTWAKKWLGLFNEASAINFFESSPEVKCPIYFFVGRQDYQTHHKLTEEYYNKVKADKKQLFWFENSAHSPNTKEPDKFQDIIISAILPATKNDR